MSDFSKITTSDLKINSWKASEGEISINPLNSTITKNKVKDNKAK
jgi:hypothetical protein